MVAEVQFNTRDLAKFGVAVREQIAMAVSQAVVNGFDEREAICVVTSMLVGVAVGCRATALGKDIDPEVIAQRVFAVIEGGSK